jgi:transcriptional regulator with XRE-family HTH domain
VWWILFQKWKRGEESERMHEAGRNLRKLREQLRLKYRDIEEASHKIATEYGNQEFAIRLSRLADIENKGTVPSIYRLYSLSAIYGMDFSTVLQWYGVNLDDLVADAAKLGIEQTRAVNFPMRELKHVQVPTNFGLSVDLRKTSYLSRHVQGWGTVPLSLLKSLDLRDKRYAFVGTEDWSMDPLIRPGSFVQIDETKRPIQNDVWNHEYDRPIYFLEHRQGFRCGWCTKRGEVLIVESHSSSRSGPDIYKYPGEAEILGRVVGVAMRFDVAKKRHKRS